MTVEFDHALQQVSYHAVPGHPRTALQLGADGVLSAEQTEIRHLHPGDDEVLEGLLQPIGMVKHPDRLTKFLTP